MMKMRSLATAFAVVAAGCGMTPTIPGLPPYRIDIQQGNYLSQEMVSQLKPGMTREQVRFVLGTPLVTDIFHQDRWDYVYFREPPGKPREQRRLAVFFDKDNKLVRVDGDVVPAAPAGEPKDAPKAEPVMPPKPVALPETRPVDPSPPTQGSNWRTASDPEPAKAEPAKEEPPKAEAPKPEPAKPEEGERGFFGRMWDKVRGKD